MAESFLAHWRAAGRAPHPGKSGALPAPLDRLNGEALAARTGAHPLAFLSAAELLTPCTSARDRFMASAIMPTALAGINPKACCTACSKGISPPGMSLNSGRRRLTVNSSGASTGLFM